MLAEESTRSGFTYAGFCLTALPHKKLPDATIWERKGYKLTLAVGPGMITRAGTSVAIGIPYGSRARLILLYLQTQAVRSQSPEVELGKSMFAWLKRMGISVGGKTYSEIKEQAERIASCNLSFFWEDQAGRKSFSRSMFVIKGLVGTDTKQWYESVRLSDDFFTALKAHPVPVWEPALRAIGNRSMAMDVYIWLTYRLHMLVDATPVSWAAVQGQFGAGFLDTGNFRRSFKESLSFALAVYPDAKVTVDSTGLILHPSPPPIDRTKIISFAGANISTAMR